jgi:hypothetical protein
VHFEVSGGCDVAGVNFQTEPAAAAFAGLAASAIGPNHAFYNRFFIPAFARAEFTAKCAEFPGEGGVHFKSGKTQGRLRQGPHRGLQVPEKEGRGTREYGACFIQQVAQAEPRERVLALATNEFSADTMAWIMPCFPNSHRNALATQADAKG